MRTSMHISVPIGIRGIVPSNPADRRVALIAFFSHRSLPVSVGVSIGAFSRN